MYRLPKLICNFVCWLTHSTKKNGCVCVQACVNVIDCFLHYWFVSFTLQESQSSIGDLIGEY